MTVSSTTTKVSYAGNGSTVAFSVPFYFLTNADLEVIARSALGAETVKIITTDYTVTGAGVLAGGTVTMVVAPASGVTLVIQRNVALTQEVDYQPNDPFPAATHEQALDKLTMEAQQINEIAARSIKLSTSNTMTSTEFTVGATDRANKVLGFDSTGELSVTQELGTLRGNWASGTSYVQRDLIKDTSNANIYICLTAHTASGSQPISSNADSAKWDLIVDAASASTSATAAAASASAASSSASAASGSASSASSSASSASTSASNASTSATNAANSATSAAASYDSFDDRYLGSQTSAPTLDNDGNALLTGALYFNSVTNLLYCYTGTVWGSIGDSISGTANRYNYIATASQTSFAATYTSPNVDVYKNGIKLVRVTQYTDTSGTAIVLATGATASDTIGIVAYGTFVVTPSGTLAISAGGTALATTPTNGQLLIGNGTNYTLSTLTAGTGVSIANSAGGISISAPASGGTVTSVAVSGGTTGLTTSGGPITSTGTITLAGTLAVANGGTGVTASTGSGNNVLSTSPTLVTPILGTPTSGTLTNATGLPISTGVSGLGTGAATALGWNVGIPGSVLVNGNVLGTPSSGLLTNATGLPISTGVSGLGTGAATALGVAVGTAGSFVVNGGVLGTPASGTLTNATGLPVGGLSATGTPSGSTFLRGDGVWAAPGGSGTVNSATAGQIAFYSTTGTAVSGSANFSISSGAVTLGAAGTTQGSVVLSGSTSGTTTLAIQTAASGTITFPATTGTVTVLGNTSTGSGSIVLATSPALITPTLGVASATSINKVAITAPATSSTLTIVDGKTLTVSNTLSFAGTDSTVMTFPSSTDTVAGIAASQTLTNKRIDPRFTSATSASTLSPDISAKDMYMFTALAAALTINAPTGTPVDGDKLIFRIKDNGSAQTLTWNAIFRTVGVGTLPTTTTAGKIVYFGCIYNSAETLWDVVALSQQA